MVMAITHYSGCTKARLKILMKNYAKTFFAAVHHETNSNLKWLDADSKGGKQLRKQILLIIIK